MAQIDFQSAAALFAKYDLPLRVAQYEKLCAYAEMLYEEGKRQNLSAVRTVTEMWTRHFLDAAYLLPYIPAGSRVIDIGTGGGIPAIPLAILGDYRVTMLDSELRKIEFCRYAIEALGLEAEAIAERAEVLAADPAYRGSYDFAVSRAMAAGSMLSELAFPFLRVGGTLIAMKGKAFDPEQERFASAVPQLGGSLRTPLFYSLEGESKYLILADKTFETPEKFPRRFAKIKRDPL